MRRGAIYGVRKTARIRYFGGWCAQSQDKGGLHERNTKSQQRLLTRLNLSDSASECFNAGLKAFCFCHGVEMVW